MHYCLWLTVLICLTEGRAWCIKKCFRFVLSRQQNLLLARGLFKQRSWPYLWQVSSMRHRSDVERAQMQRCVSSDDEPVHATGSSHTRKTVCPGSSQWLKKGRNADPRNADTGRILIWTAQHFFQCQVFDARLPRQLTMAYDKQTLMVDLKTKETNDWPFGKLIKEQRFRLVSVPLSIAYNFEPAWSRAHPDATCFFCRK